MNMDSNISSSPPEAPVINDDMETGPRTGSIRSGSDVEDTIGDEFQLMNPPEPEQESLLPAIILMGKRRFTFSRLYIRINSILTLILI